MLLWHRWWHLVCLCCDPAVQLPDLAGVQAVHELRQRQGFPAVEIRGAKDLLQLRVQQLPPVSEVQDLHRLFHGHCPLAVLVVHEEQDHVEEASRLVPCMTEDRALLCDLSGKCLSGDPHRESPELDWLQPTTF